MTNNMASSGLWKMLNLATLYLPQMGPLLRDVWKVENNADDMADGEAMW